MYFEHWNGGHVLRTLEWRTCTEDIENGGQVLRTLECKDMY